MCYIIEPYMSQKHLPCTRQDRIIYCIDNKPKYQNERQVRHTIITGNIWIMKKHLDNIGADFLDTLSCLILSIVFISKQNVNKVNKLI